MVHFEVGLAFLEGLALIASPCILPVLPLILSSSIDGGKRRPYGIILGFIVSFSIFSFSAHTIVKLTGVDLNLIKNGSLILLGLFGALMIVPSLWTKLNHVTARLATWGSTITMTSSNGLLSGLALGALIGLVWTPCAGPILAAVFVQIIRQETHIGSLLMILAFATGVAIPMLILTLTGKEMIKHFNSVVKHGDTIRRILGVLVLLSVVYLATGFNIVRSLPANELNDNKNRTLLIQAIQPYGAPEFSEIEAWLNSPPLSMHELKGKVVLIDFWTYSCINCVRTLPYVTAWHEKYKDKGLVIVGVHAPEFEFEKNIDNVKIAIAKYHITYPVALDNHLNTWQNFNNRYWPAHYLINPEGQVVYVHFGEGDYNITEHNIQVLLELDKKGALVPETNNEYVSIKTPETYLGSLRMQHFGSKEDAISNQAVNYHFPKYLPLHHWALQGKWEIEKEKIVSGPGSASLMLNFYAKKVFLVLGNANGKSIEVTMRLNGEPLGPEAGQDAPNGHVIVKGHALFELINQSNFSNALLEIHVSEPGLEAYAFTFE